MRMSRPRFWLASFVPIHLGYVLATHRLIPRLSDAPTLLLAAVVTGPLLWLAVLAFNDAHDLDSDKANPRKADSPLVSGRMSPRIASRIGTVAGATAVVAAAPLGFLFSFGTALMVALGWVYSAPPLRLKAQPGADVLLNSGAVGILGPLGGWVAITGTTDGFPWPIAVIGVLAAAALYLPTTIADHDADRSVGIRTTAVVLGPRATFELGFALWLGSAAVAFVLAMGGVVVDESLLPMHVIMAPVLLTLYRVLLRNRPDFRAITIVAGAYGVPCAAFVLTYVGLL